jgi:hypothetical protein
MSSTAGCERLQPEPLSLTFDEGEVFTLSFIQPDFLLV